VSRKAYSPPPEYDAIHYRCDAFRNDLARARELQAEVWADELVDISDAELPTREAIRRARLRMQSRQWLAGKYNSRFADKPNQTQVNVAVGVVLPEAERVKLLERHERAMLANQGKSGDGAPIPPEPVKQKTTIAVPANSIVEYNSQFAQPLSFPRGEQLCRMSIPFNCAVIRVYDDAGKGGRPPLVAPNIEGGAIPVPDVHSCVLGAPF
jgi:hypothetical protein